MVLADNYLPSETLQKIRPLQPVHHQGIHLRQVQLYGSAVQALAAINRRR